MKPLSHFWHAANQHGKPIKFLIARLLVKTGLCRFFTINCRLFKLKFAQSTYLADYWIDPKIDTRPEYELLLKVLRPGDIMIDVGANHGITALTGAAKVGRTGKVFAMEPHPRIYRNLGANVLLNDFDKVIITENCAVGDKNGFVSFSDSLKDDSGNHVDPDGSLTVPIRRLDDLVSSEKIRLLKVDVEGYERFVFEGASKILDRTELVFFEANSEECRRQGYAVTELIEQLHCHGFRVFRFAERELVAGFTEVTFEYSSNQIENLLGCRDPDSIIATLL